MSFVEKLVKLIKEQIPEYAYDPDDFMVIADGENHSVINWKLNIEQPSNDKVEKVKNAEKVKVKVRETETDKRMKLLEARILAIEEEMKTFV